MTQPVPLASLGILAAVLATVVSTACLSSPTTSPNATAPVASAPAQSLQQVVERELATFQARTGVHVKHLPSGEEAAVRADQPFNSFSVIKLAIMVRAYQLADAGTLDLDQRVEVRVEDFRDGSGSLYTFDPGLRVTVRDLITQMITTSDNTATDMVLERVGGLNALNAWLQQTGYGNTRLIHTMLGVFRQFLEVHDPAYKSLSSEDVFAFMTHPSMINPRLRASQGVKGAELQKAVPFGEVIPKLTALWNDDPAYWLGSMTARETSRMLEAIERGTLTSEESTAQMQRILGQQREGRLRLPHYLPWPDYFVAHKTGDGPPGIANDVGIIYGPIGPVVISFFGAANTEPYADHEDRIGRLARVVVDYLAARAPAPTPAPAPSR